MPTDRTPHRAAARVLLALGLGLALAGCGSKAGSWTRSFNDWVDPVDLDNLPSEPVSRRRAAHIADAVGMRELDKFNQTAFARRIGGPFDFDDYERSFTQETDRDGLIYWFSYRYTEKLDVEGYPSRFSVWVYRATARHSFFPGR